MVAIQPNPAHQSDPIVVSVSTVWQPKLTIARMGAVNAQSAMFSIKAA